MQSNRLWQILRANFYHYLYTLKVPKEKVYDIDKIRIKEKTTFPNIIEVPVVANPGKCYARVITNPNEMPNISEPHFKIRRYKKMVSYEIMEDERAEY